MIPSSATSPIAKCVVLVGAGIMSATLGALLRRLEPDWSIIVIERLDAALEPFPEARIAAAAALAVRDVEEVAS